MHSLATNVLPPAVGLSTTSDAARQEDTQLLDAIRRGDPGSTEALYHRYKRRVFALISRIVGYSEAEEVAQEAFVRIFRGLPKFRGESALATWIYRLAVNVALNHRSSLRRFAFFKKRQEAEAPSRPLTDMSTAPTTPDTALRTRLTRAMDKLPPGYRAVIVLHDVEGLEHEEVAAILGCRVGTSKSQLHKARKKLRDFLLAEGITASAIESQ